MEIFIRDIPPGTTRGELKQFVERGCRTLLPFGPRGRLVSCSILKISDPQGRTEYHGLVEVRPDRAAERVIRRLNGRSLKGRTVEVRPFYHRRRVGERRGKEDPIRSASTRDRRLDERRRSQVTRERLISGNVSIPFGEETDEGGE